MNQEQSGGIHGLESDSLLHLGVVTIEKEAFGSSSTKFANLLTFSTVLQTKYGLKNVS